MNEIEKAIFANTVTALISAGHNVTVDYDHGYESSGVTEANTMEELIAAADAVDEVWLMVDRSGDTYLTFVYFIWANGNEGRECISDYCSSLEELIDPICEWADTAEATLI